MEIELNGEKVNRTSNYKYLRIHLDQPLTFEDHFSKTYKQAANRLNLLRIRGFVDSSTAELNSGNANFWILRVDLPGLLSIVQKEN